MESEFTLTIQLGDDAMQSGRDVAGVLENVAARLSPITGALAPGEEGSGMDANGNTVAEWRVTSEEG